MGAQYRSKMSAAGMLRGTRSIFSFIILVHLIGCAYSYPLQFLPSIPGYIPVYIRHGDQPLEEINPALVKAFHEKPLRKSVRFDNLSPRGGSVFEEDNHKFTTNSKKFYPRINLLDFRQEISEDNNGKDDNGKPVPVESKQQQDNEKTPTNLRSNIQKISFKPDLKINHKGEIIDDGKSKSQAV